MHLITFPTSFWSYLHVQVNMRFPEFESTIPTCLCTAWTCSSFMSPRKHDWSKPGSGSDRMAPAGSEHSSGWPFLSHSSGYSSLEEDKEQQGHTEDQLLSVLNLWLCNILQLCFYCHKYFHLLMHWKLCTGLKLHKRNKIIIWQNTTQACLTV